MGAAKIVSNLGEGRYTATKVVSGLDGALAWLANRRAYLEAELPKMRNAEGKYWSDVVSARQNLDTLIQQWIEGAI